LIPLSDASRRPVRLPVVTAFIVVVNVFVFLLELMRGDAFVMEWSAIPAQIISGHHWITILTAMFMHGSWSHIIGNMIFLWAFGPEIEDAMGAADTSSFIWLEVWWPCLPRFWPILILRFQTWARVGPSLQ
jgi:membrane associated rhomboid family serine protease